MKDQFTDIILEGYTFKGDTLNMGAAMYEGETQTGTFVQIPLKTLNRHGLIAGATGTGKTKTLQIVAEQLANKGVPSLLMDIKGDLSGIAVPSPGHPKIDQRHIDIGFPFEAKGSTVEFLSLSDEPGVRLRATVTEFGPVLFSKILALSDAQAGVVSVIFKYCDDHNLPLLDLKDFKKTLQFLTNEGKKEAEKDYGRLSTASVGAIMRKLIALEQQGADRFFGEVSFDVDDLTRIDDQGRGMVSILRLTDLQDRPQLFSTFMMSLLAEVYSTFPEIGDPDQPELVIFIDEAHLIFDNASDELLDQIETIIKLIRSKGVGIIFITQNPADVPDDVLGQLGLKIQQCHTVAENRPGHIQHVFGRRSQPTIQQRACTNGQHQGLRSAGSRAPGNGFLNPVNRGWVLWTKSAYKIQNHFQHTVSDWHPPQQSLGSNKFICGEYLVCFLLFYAGGRQQDVPFRRTVRVVHVDLHQEPVQLCLGQRIRAFLLNRVLCCQHVKRWRQGPVFSGDGHLPFLHRLKQCRLGARAGAVDFIRHQQLAENRPGNEFEGPAAVGTGFQHLRAQNIRRHQVRCELNAVSVQPHDRGQRFDQPGFAKPRQSDQQAMTTAKQCRQRQIHNSFLPDESTGDRTARLCQSALERFDFGHQIGGFTHDKTPVIPICFPTSVSCGPEMAKVMSGQNVVTPNAESLARAARAAKGRGIPPVHKWNPPFCGDLDMRIARDGTWFYLGTPIGRFELVRLFSSILRKDDDKYFLVTPVEKVGITVDDAPFVAVDFETEGAGKKQTLTFETHVGDHAVAGPEHPIRVQRNPETGEPSPYILIRANLDALIDRKSFYRLVDLGAHHAMDGQSWFGLWSGGAFFPIIPSNELA